MQPLILGSSFDGSAHLLPDLFMRLKAPNQLSFLTITTAAYPYGTPNLWLEKEIATIKNTGIKLHRFDTTHQPIEEVHAMLNAHDNIFIIGGNTFHLLKEIQRTQLLPLIQEKRQQGNLIMASSAGSIVLGPDINYIKPMEDTSCPELDETQGLGLTHLSIIPHLNDAEMGAVAQEIMTNTQNSSHTFLALHDHQIALITQNSAEIIS